MDYSDTTVMVPVKDEPAVADVTKRVLENLPGCKVVVVYKGYNDNLNLGFANERVTIIKQVGSGKGVAVVQAAKQIHTDIMCLIDGDATYEPNDLKKVVEMVRGGSDMALGNRLHDMDLEAMPSFIQFGNKVITIVANIIYGMGIKDSQTGLRAIKKDKYDTLDLEEQYFGIESEMNVKSHKKGYKITETPISYYKRVGESKQMKLVDGIKLLLLDFKWITYKG